MGMKNKLKNAYYKTKFALQDSRFKGMNPIRRYKASKRAAAKQMRSQVRMNAIQNIKQLQARVPPPLPARRPMVPPKPLMLRSKPVSTPSPMPVAKPIRVVTQQRSSVPTMKSPSRPPPPPPKKFK